MNEGASFLQTFSPKYRVSTELRMKVFTFLSLFAALSVSLSVFTAAETSKRMAVRTRSSSYLFIFSEVMWSGVGSFTVYIPDTSRRFQFHIDLL